MASSAAPSMILRRAQQLQSRLHTCAMARKSSVTKDKWNRDLTAMTEHDRYHHLWDRLPDAKECAQRYPLSHRLLTFIGNAIGNRLQCMRENMSRVSSETDTIHLLLAIPRVIQEMILNPTMDTSSRMTNELAFFLHNDVSLWQQKIQEEEMSLDLLSDAFWKQQFVRAQSQIVSSMPTPQPTVIDFSNEDLRHWQLFRVYRLQIQEQKLQMNCLVSVVRCLLGQLLGE